RRVRLPNRDGAARPLPARARCALPAQDDAGRRPRRPLRPGGAAMRAFLAMLGIGLTLSAVSGAQAYHRFWLNCNYDAPTFMTTMTRDAGEGYQGGGGGWTYDDADSYPHDPPEQAGTHGEGGDCSGLTFKTWRESTDDWRDGRYYWRALRNVHGPYTAADFRAGYGAPNHTVAKSTAGVMDAFASSTHIGMVFVRSL